MAFPSLDLWQYRLSAVKSANAHPVGEMWLELGADLPMIALKDAKGTPIGHLLGHPIDLAARSLIADSWQTPDAFDGAVEGFVHSVLNALGGRFLWFFDTGAGVRVYPDCSSQIPCVFDPEQKVLGSTAHALFDDAEYEARFDKALFDELGVDGEGWFTAGLTAHKGLHRLLPNHYLDLSSFQVTRSWSGNKIDYDDPHELVDEFITLVQAQVEALAKGPKKIAMALTAGLDSRTVLACARPYIKDIECFTVTGGDRHEVDTVIAKRISKTMGLRHITLARATATADQKATFLRRGGHCNGDSNALYHPTVWPLAKEHVFLGGAGGEISRPPVMRPGDTGQTELTPLNLLNRLGLRTSDRVLAQLETYKRDMGDVDSLQVIDLLFQEARFASWYGVQFCSDPTLIRHAPLLSTRQVELMMNVPIEWKKSEDFFRAVIQKCWPELDAFPYNSLGWLRDKYVDLRRVMKDPSLIGKKLRKLRA